GIKEKRSRWQSVDEYRRIAVVLVADGRIYAARPGETYIRLFLDESVVVIVNNHECALYYGLGEGLIDEPEAGLPAVCLGIVVTTGANCFGEERGDWSRDMKDAGKHIQT